MKMKLGFGRGWSRVAYVGVAFLMISGCDKKKPEQEDEPSFTYQLTPDEANAELSSLSSRIYFDPGLTSRERRFLGFDFRQMRRLSLASQSAQFFDDQTPAAYQTLFGSTTASPLDFVFERIKVIATHESEVNNEDMLGAMNMGFAYWLGMLMENPHQVREEEIAPGVRLRFDSPRVGLIMLGKAYSKLDRPVLRASMLIHEARHSDCPGGLSKAALDKLKEREMERKQNGKELTPSDLKEVLGNCSFTHIECPTGHSLAGMAACEGPKGWGAYAVQAIHGYAFFRDCENCTEEEKQDSLMTYGEMAGRVSDWAGLLTGKYGLPDMRHSGYLDR